MKRGRRGASPHGNKFGRIRLRRGGSSGAKPIARRHRCAVHKCRTHPDSWPRPIVCRRPVGGCRRCTGRGTHDANARLLPVPKFPDPAPALPGNRGTDIVVTAGQINRFKVLRKTDRQSLCSSGVILIEDYTEWFHKFPLTTPRFAAALAATANC